MSPRVLMPTCMCSSNMQFQQGLWDDRWGGGDQRPAGGSGVKTDADDSSEEEVDPDEARRVHLNNEIKKSLTSILVQVTDSMFGASVLSSQLDFNCLQKLHVVPPELRQLVLVKLVWFCHHLHYLHLHHYLSR